MHLVGQGLYQIGHDGALARADEYSTEHGALPKLDLIDVGGGTRVSTIMLP